MNNIETLKLLVKVRDIANEYDYVDEEAEEFTDDMAPYIGMSLGNVENEIATVIKAL